MSTPEVTVIMVPRERYSGIQAAIASLYENTADIPFKLVYVDGGLPARVKAMVEQEAASRGFSFIHKEHPLTPNEARNIGLQQADTEFVVFSDNDVLFTPNWLELLLAAAREYDAWLVGPTILDGDPETGKIHAAAGNSGFQEVDGKKRYKFVPGHMQQHLDVVKDDLKRGPTTMLEFHVLLARRDVFEKIGPLDERVSSFGDHDDLVHQVLNAGGPVIFEPASIVAYHDPGTNIHVLEQGDLPMYFLRWSDAWNFGSIERAAEKWNLDPEDPWVEHAKHWVRVRRSRALSLCGPTGKLVGFTMYKVNKPLGEKLEQILCDRITRPLKTQ